MNSPIEEKLRILRMLQNMMYPVHPVEAIGKIQLTVWEMLLSVYMPFVVIDGRCISLLKILMTNYCIYDFESLYQQVAICRKAIFSPDEIKQDYYKLFIEEIILKDYF